jgi:cobalt-zinc-cadmium efflux system membrane fusion protein
MNTSLKTGNLAVAAIILVTVAVAVIMLLSPDNTPHDHSNGDHHAGNDDNDIKGPHGGRLLSKDDFSLEITLFESGLPPEFRVYANDGNKPANLQDVSLVIKLKRLGDITDHIQFSPQQDYLRGDTVVHEPHSFDVIVDAEFQGKRYSWQFESYEGRTTIADDMAEQVGIKTEIAGPVTLSETRTLTGRIQTNPNRLSHVRARFPGVVIKINKELGDQVKAGDILATVQSDESLQNYQVKAPIAGQIVKREIQVGEATSENPLFIIADLSEVWIELDIFVRDLNYIKVGQPVVLESLQRDYSTIAKIDWISPLAMHASQSVHARVIVPNTDDALRPGQFVRAHVTVAENMVPLAVRQSALQRFRDHQVVFVKFDETYEVRMLKLGRSNREWVEVLDGIDPGNSYVTDNSYLIKADIEKSGAGHDH